MTYEKTFKQAARLIDDGFSTVSMCKVQGCEDTFFNSKTGVFVEARNRGKKGVFFKVSWQRPSRNDGEMPLPKWAWFEFTESGLEEAAEFAKKIAAIPFAER